MDVWIAIMLAGITLIVTLIGVILAFFAIGIGALAFWGYGGMKEEAVKVASNVAEKRLAEYFEKQDEKDRLRSVVILPDHPAGEGGNN